MVDGGADELADAIQAQALLYSSTGPVQKGKKTSTGSFDRWNPAEKSSIDYGFFDRWDRTDPGTGSSFYLTTAINYTNGPPHMGHAYEATTADAIARFFRLNGSGPTYFVTGSDEHGQKIANTASGQGKEPIEICDLVSHDLSNERGRGAVRGCRVRNYSAIDPSNG